MIVDLVSGTMALAQDVLKPEDVPSSAEIQRIMPGDLVKVAIVFKPEFGELATGERFWVEVLEVSAPVDQSRRYTGVVQDWLEYASTHGIDKGDAICFDATHVLVTK